MKLFSKYREGEIKDGIINFCWKDKHVGTILYIVIPIWHERYALYLRLRNKLRYDGKPWKECDIKSRFIWHTSHWNTIEQTDAYTS